MCSTAQASITSSSQEPWQKQLLVYGPPYPTPVYLSIATELKKLMICLRLEIWPSITLTTHACGQALCPHAQLSKISEIYGIRRKTTEKSPSIQRF